MINLFGCWVIGWWLIGSGFVWKCFFYGGCLWGGVVGVGVFGLEFDIVYVVGVLCVVLMEIFLLLCFCGYFCFVFSCLKLD